MIGTKRRQSANMFLPLPLPLLSMRRIFPHTDGQRLAFAPKAWHLVVRTSCSESVQFSTPSCFSSQGSVEAAAKSRKSDALTAQQLALEAAEVKKNLSENGSKQRDVSGGSFFYCHGVSCIPFLHCSSCNTLPACSSPPEAVDTGLIGNRQGCGLP